MSKNNDWIEYTFDELIDLYLPNVVYIKNNEEHKQKLSDILYAYLSGTFKIDIVNDKWLLKSL